MIPKTVTPSRITENLKATEIKLDAEDMKRLRELESKNFRCLKVLIIDSYCKSAKVNTLENTISHRALGPLQ